MKTALISTDIEKRARLMALAGDPTRLRIFCLLFEKKEACVSEIAESLEMSVANISHHLQLLKDNGLVEAERMGTTICYRMAVGAFITQLRRLLCDTPLP